MVQDKSRKLPTDADRHLAEKLLLGNAEDVQRFINDENDRVIAAATEAFGSATAAANRVNQLATPLCKSLASGYLKTTEEDETTLQNYLQSIRLPDLMIACACARGDSEAWQGLQQIISGQVAAALRRVWTGRAPNQVIDDTIDELLGFCVSKSVKGGYAGESRMAGFHGRSALSTWLYAIAANKLREYLRKERKEGLSFDRIGPETRIAGGTDQQPTKRMESDEAYAAAIAYRSRLVDALERTLRAMPERRRIAAWYHWLRDKSPAEVADLMDVSRPRITELLGQARQDFSKATDALCDEIAHDSGRPAHEIKALLESQLASLLQDIDDEVVDC